MPSLPHPQPGTMSANGCTEKHGAGRLSRVWPAVAASVAEARNAVTAFAEAAGATGDALAAVSLAVSEAVTNAVLHAYLDHDEPGPVQVRARREAQSVIVEVADQGRGMLPRTDSPGPPRRRPPRRARPRPGARPPRGRERDRRGGRSGARDAAAHGQPRARARAAADRADDGEPRGPRPRRRGHRDPHGLRADRHRLSRPAHSATA